MYLNSLADARMRRVPEHGKVCIYRLCPSVIEPKIPAKWHTDLFLFLCKFKITVFLVVSDARTIILQLVIRLLE